MRTILLVGILVVCGWGRSDARELVLPIPCSSTIAGLSRLRALQIMGVQLKEAAPRVFHLNFSSKARMSYSFLRFQEFYENPHFRGLIFSMSEFRNWYRANTGRNNKFTYLSDWGGFNIPSSVFEPFHQGRFDPLSRHEALLLRVGELLGNNFYLIGTHGSQKVDLVHELAHGLWATNPAYRAEMQAAMSEMQTSIIRRRLKATGGYHPDVYDDETQAYLITDLSGLFRRPKDNRVIDKYIEDIQKLKRIFEKYKSVDQAQLKE